MTILLARNQHAAWKQEPLQHEWDKHSTTWTSETGRPGVQHKSVHSQNWMWNEQELYRCHRKQKTSPYLLASLIGVGVLNDNEDVVLGASNWMVYLPNSSPSQGSDPVRCNHDLMLLGTNPIIFHTTFKAAKSRQLVESSESSPEKGEVILRILGRSTNSSGVWIRVQSIL